MAVAATGLSPAQVAHFHEMGYLLVPDLFRPHELQPLIDEISAVIDAVATAQLAAGEIPDAYADEGFLTRLTRLHRHSDRAYRALHGGQHCGEQMFELIRHPRLLDIAASLVGPEVVASSAFRIRPKMPDNEATVVPWHQDSGYFEPGCDQSLIVTVWIPLLDATVDNGCLWVVPGVHRQPVLPHWKPAGKGYYLIDDERMPVQDAVPVEVPLGGALLLTNRTPHKSTPHSVDVVRWSVDIRYQGADAPSPAVPAAVRQTVSADDMPAMCYAPEADFLVRSAARPEAVVGTWDEFHRLRTTHQPGPPPQRWPTVALEQD